MKLRPPYCSNRSKDRSRSGRFRSLVYVLRSLGSVSPAPQKNDWRTSSRREGNGNLTLASPLSLLLSASFLSSFNIERLQGFCSEVPRKLLIQTRLQENGARTRFSRAPKKKLNLRKREDCYFSPASSSSSLPERKEPAWGHLQKRVRHVFRFFGMMPFLQFLR